MKWLIIAAITLAASAGFLTSLAVGGSSALTPSTTVTVEIPAGITGPAGPPGPPGPAGVQDCPAGSVFGKLVINAPGGQTALYACIVG